MKWTLIVLLGVLLLIGLTAACAVKAPVHFQPPPEWAAGQRQAGGVGRTDEEANPRAGVWTMTPVEPIALHDGGRLVIFAKDQPQYHPLPASVSNDGLVMTEWEPTAEELTRLFMGGRIRLWIHTYGQPLQPVSLEAVEAECGSEATG